MSLFDSRVLKIIFIINNKFVNATIIFYAVFFLPYVVMI